MKDARGRSLGPRSALEGEGRTARSASVGSRIDRHQARARSGARRGEGSCAGGLRICFRIRMKSW